MNEFSQYVLRTTDAPAATAFYDAVLGRHGDAVFPLHEQAVARGARPVAAAKGLGASMLPSSALPDGRRYAVGDDPQGAAFGLMERAA